MYYIAHSTKIRNTPFLLAKMRFSSIVLYELVTTTISADDLDLYERWSKLQDKNGTSLTPGKTHWWETAKLIRRLRFGDKSAARGLTPKIKHAHQLQNDALIARTAALANVMW